MGPVYNIFRVLRGGGEGGGVHISKEERREGGEMACKLSMFSPWSYLCNLPWSRCRGKAAIGIEYGVAHIPVYPIPKHLLNFASCSPLHTRDS